MPKFDYVAREMSGKRVKGTLTANTERDVLNSLSAKSLFPVSVTSAEKSQVQFSGRVSGAKIAGFYSQLASLIKNGVPLLRSLTLLRDQTGLPQLKKALTDIITRVEDGDTLSEGFARHPKIFNDMAINMSRAGARRRVSGGSARKGGDFHRTAGGFKATNDRLIDLSARSDDLRHNRCCRIAHLFCPTIHSVI